MCSNKTVRPATQMCIKSLNCQTGKHQLSPANRSRTHTQGAGQSMLFINNLQEGIHLHTCSPCHPSVNSTGKHCLLSHPILHFCQLPKNLEKQFTDRLLCYRKLLEFPKLLFSTTDAVQNQQRADCKVRQKLIFSPAGENIS